mmetsp:Transcript_5522/g.8793  ORF Transcript_5522/g.8793 Transcript_5522/m.8793 type:complete len:387 (+) Transcript_5522:85-1245(+)
MLRGARAALALAVLALVLVGEAQSLHARASRGRNFNAKKGQVLEGEEGGDACVTAEFPLTFRHHVDFNINEGLGVFKDEDTNLQCSCEEKECKCTGEGEDCDEYSQMWFYMIAYAHQFGAFFYDLPEYEEKYHLQSMAFWGIMGIVLGWIGVILILYMEIKAVTVTRERDERQKLIQIRAMERSGRHIELEEKEAKIMAPRPYITLCGSILLFVGLFCQLIPFCHLLRELSLPVESHGLCVLFVFVSSFMLCATSVLVLMGLIWSCTRGWAAVVFLALGLSGDIMLFAGSLACLIWAVLAGSVLWLYFLYLPELYKDCKDVNDPNNGTYPMWLQDAGEFQVDPDLGKMGEAFSGAGSNFVTDLTSNPVGEKAKQGWDKLTGNGSTV